MKTVVKPQIQRRPANLAFDGLGSCSALLAAIYGARGLAKASDLNRKLDQLPRPTSLKGVERAVSRIIAAFEQQQRILIIGDFDADGATSSCLMVLALKRLGAVNVDFLVPNRFEYGYGLTPEIVQQALHLKPDIIITVDNGIASIAGVALANSHGIDVIVTDHHLPGTELPAAYAIVNPNQPGCDFPSKAIAGVGVAFFLLLALRGALRENQWFVKQHINEPNLAEYLDIVALGTVADVVPLDAVNRILVHQGLLRIRAGRCTAGIKALLTVAKRDFQYITAADLGFAVGPRLNAAGRLDDMSVGIHCLMADNDAEAWLMATELDALNADRRQIEQGMQAQAEQALDAVYADIKQLPAGLCLYRDDWHQGVVGIVASRIKERYYRPVIAFAKTENGVLKGSARSIEGVHIRDVLALIATQRPDILQQFGGHSMAAGLSLNEAHYEVFQQLFNDAIQRSCSDEVFNNIVCTDGELSAAQIQLELARELELAGPWGQAFPEPKFDNIFEVVQQRLLADKHLKLVLRHLDNNTTVDAIAFNIDPGRWPDASVKRVRLVYRLGVNRYRGAETLQLMIDYIEAVAD